MNIWRDPKSAAPNEPGGTAQVYKRHGYNELWTSPATAHTRRQAVAWQVGSNLGTYRTQSDPNHANVKELLGQPDQVYMWRNVVLSDYLVAIPPVKPSVTFHMVTIDLQLGFFHNHHALLLQHLVFSR